MPKQPTVITNKLIQLYHAKWSCKHTLEIAGTKAFQSYLLLPAKFPEDDKGFGNL